jgi:hypothetical protein
VLRLIPQSRATTVEGVALAATDFSSATAPSTRHTHANGATIVKLNVCAHRLGGTLREQAGPVAHPPCMTQV